MRPYNRSLHPDDYGFLAPFCNPIRAFLDDMLVKGVPQREWHPHRFWEYASIMQQLTALAVPQNAEIIDIGSGASFFDPYLALQYPNLCCTDTEKYGDYSWMVAAQRAHYGVALPLYNIPVEDMSPHLSIGWGDAADKFDVTMCISSIEHVDGHDAGFREMVRITKPGGLIMITSDYFRDLEHFERSVSRHLQVTPYRKEFVEELPAKFGLEFVGSTDLDYRGDFVHNYSFCNLCLRKPVSTESDPL
jgi:SAM-dependent methyltransferase